MIVKTGIPQSVPKRSSFDTRINKNRHIAFRVIARHGLMRKMKKKHGQFPFKNLIQCFHSRQALKRQSKESVQPDFAYEAKQMALSFSNSGSCKSIYRPFVSEIQTESPKVTGRVVSVDHHRRRDRDKEFVSGPELEQSSLVNRVKGVLCVWSPAFGPDTL